MLPITGLHHANGLPLACSHPHFLQSPEHWSFFSYGSWRAGHGVLDPIFQCIDHEWSASLTTTFSGSSLRPRDGKWEKKRTQKGAWQSSGASESEISLVLERDISEAAQAGLSEYSTPGNNELCCFEVLTYSPPRLTRTSGSFSLMNTSQAQNPSVRLGLWMIDICCAAVDLGCGFFSLPALLVCYDNTLALWETSIF